ncbi:hypothetical protein [Mycolicibacterium sediminis]|uniref:Uncharacterized protein n=1 Tax=Mycolicibacterium sediminis TaxID=1286180 RepID=A0A7I7QN80_9MYCO|nr:hypothetical protein [Mycolicibacterium sediminis]BBY27276.1 hypothetical protein MSEDJ_13720 [Mycolicibacterium sediminis]
MTDSDGTCRAPDADDDDDDRLCRRRAPGRNELPTAAVLGLPQQSLFALPMRRQPLPGWRIGAAALGLDSNAHIRYSTIRNAGDRAAFLAMTTLDWFVNGQIEVSAGGQINVSTPCGDS